MNKVFSSSFKMKERRRECSVIQFEAATTTRTKSGQTAMKSISPFDEWNIYESNFFVFHLLRIEDVSLSSCWSLLSFVFFLLSDLSISLSLSLAHSVIRPLACNGYKSYQFKTAGVCNLKTMKQHKNTQHSNKIDASHGERKKKSESKNWKDKKRSIEKEMWTMWLGIGQHIELNNKQSNWTKNYGKSNQLENEIY